MSFPWNDPDDVDCFEEEQDLGCDYGLSEFCEDPFARDTGCTVNCGLYLETVSQMNKIIGLESTQLTFIQKIKLRIFGHVYLEHRHLPGWSGPLPFYAFKCSKHGIVENYPYGRKEKLHCPVCLNEQ